MHPELLALFSMLVSILFILVTIITFTRHLDPCRAPREGPANFILLYGQHLPQPHQNLGSHEKGEKVAIS